MNIVKRTTLGQVRAFLAGTADVGFKPLSDDAERYRLIPRVVRQLRYLALGRIDRGTVHRYLERVSGYSRAQVTRLVHQYLQTGRLRQHYAKPKAGFVGRFTPADIGLLTDATTWSDSIGRKVEVRHRVDILQAMRDSFRVLWVLAGIVSLLVGVVGAVLPVLPTTPFVLIAAFCFSRGSSRFERWLLEHRLFGPIVRDWRKHHAVPRRAKQLAYAMMAISSIGSAIMLPLAWGWVPAACCAFTAVWVYRLPTRGTVNSNQR